MSNDIKVNIVVSDNETIKRTTTSAEKLRATLSEAAASATNTSKALHSAKLSTGGTAGSRSSGAQPGGESVAYARSRGTIGTGAEARDFAKQSEGLGGLVRLYATYAANIYAAGAAFRALSEAANTANIVQGLNQLGAASGVALGGLSKKFADASGGAISFREAMQSTAVATSAGLSSKQFLQLGDIAKKTSQALGIGMSDAVSRLTRGITKLEPELLDELGLFTKIGPATENYAKSIGKSAASLTDFEKRQAFANAVLKEGNDKFSEIDIPTNPYDKLLSTLKNVSFTILELVNKALTPLVTILSESPAALTTIIAGLGTMILKSALPALGHYKTGLRETADASQKLWEGKASAAANALAVVKASNKKEILAEQEKIAEIKQARVEEYQSNLRDLAKGTTTRGTQQKLQSILDPSRAVTDISKTEIKWLEARGKGNTVLAATYAQVAVAIKAAQKAEQDYINTGKKLDIKNAQAPGRYSQATLTAIAAEKARKISTSKNIIAQAGEDTSTRGLRTAFVNLGKSVKEGELGAVKSTFTGIAGAASIVTTKIGGIISSFSGLLPYLGLAIAGYQLLSSWLSKNSKETEVYNSALDDLTEKTETATRVQKLYGETLSVASILAKATAITNLADSVEATSNALKEANAKAGGFDKFIDGFLTVIGKDLKSKFTNTMSYSISEGLKTIADPALRTQAQDQIKALLDIKETTKEAIQSALDSTATPEEILAKGDAISKVMKTVAAAADEAAKPLKPVKEGFIVLEKAYTELANSLTNKDLLTTFALALINQSNILKDAFGSVQNTVATLNEVLLDTAKVSKFPQEARDSILDAAANYKTLKDSIDDANKAKAAGQSKVDAARGILAPYAGKAVPKEVLEVVSRLEIEGLVAISAASDTISTANDKLAKISTNLTTGLNASMAQGFKYIQAPLVTAIAMANINSQKALLGALPQTADTAKYAAQLEVEAIGLKKTELTTLNNLITTIDKDRLSREKIAVEAKIAALPQERFDSIKTPARIKLEEQLQTIKNQEEAYKDGGKSLKNRTAEELGPGTADILNRQSGFEKQMVELSNQQQIAIINGILNATKASFADASKMLDTELATVKAANTKFFGSAEFALKSQGEQDIERGKRLSEETALADAKARLAPLEKGVVAAQVEEQALAKKLPTRLGKLAADAGTAADEEFRKLQDTQGVIAATVAIEVDRAANISKITVEEDKAQKIREANLALSNIAAQSSLDQLDADKNRLDLQMSIGSITKDDYDNQSRILEVKKIGIESDKKRNELLVTYMGNLADIAKEEADPKNADKTAALSARKTVIEETYKAELAGLNTSIALKIETQKQQEKVNERTKVYADAFNNTVGSMSDALVDFALTGKASFGDMIKSMIIDLIKFEQRQMMMAAYQGMGGGGGFMNFLGGIAKAGMSYFGDPNSLGFSGMNAPSYATAGELDNNGGFGPGTGSMRANALGGVYDQGRVAFAKGGTFSNTIVSRPTTFAFAKGAGLMGESGPEAIMPLKRGPNGSLGVQGGGGSNVDVVVNNYGTEKATTKETTDARGNRRIEVIIGEMTAAEMTRPNSPVQTSMRSTFGLAPSLTRR